MAWPVSPDCWRNVLGGKTWQTGEGTIDWPSCTRSWTITSKSSNPIKLQWSCASCKVPPPPPPPTHTHTHTTTPTPLTHPRGRALFSAPFPGKIAYPLPHRRLIHSQHLWVEWRHPSPRRALSPLAEETLMGTYQVSDKTRQPRGRHTNTQGDRDRQRDRQKDRQRDRHGDRQTDIHMQETTIPKSQIADTYDLFRFIPNGWNDTWHIVVWPRYDTVILF